MVDRDLILGLLVLGRYERPVLDELASFADVELDVLWYADERFFRDCYSALGYCAAKTQRVALGPCVTDPYSRHPAITAASIATLDELSGGRAILGIGAGVSGFPQLGIARERPAVALREGIQLIRALLSGERLTFEGATVRFHDGELDFPARPDLPIYVATQGPRILEVTGELADGVIVEAYASESALGYVRAHLSSGAAKAGRRLEDLALVARLDTCIADDERDDFAVIKPRIARTLMMEWPNFVSMEARGLAVSAALQERVAGIGYTRNAEILGRAAAHIPDEWVPQFALAGTRGQVLQQIRSLRRLGVDQIITFPLPSPGMSAIETAREFAAIARLAGVGE